MGRDSRHPQGRDCSLSMHLQRKREEEGLRAGMAESNMGELRMPRHVAIILDGNGRWAKAKGLPRNMGHVEGAKTVETI